MAFEGKSGGRGGFRGPKPVPEYEQQIIDLARVTRVMAGGKRMRFRATVVIGDKKGKVGWAVAKGADVTIAVNKAATKAKKNMIKVVFHKNTIPHKVEVKFKACKLMIKPAVEGTGIVAGGAARSVLEMAGVPNIYSKIISGTGNKLSVAQATFKALQSLQYPKKTETENRDKLAEAAAAALSGGAEAEANLLEDNAELEKKQEDLLKKEGLDEQAIGSKNILKTIKK